MQRCLMVLAALAMPLMAAAQDTPTLVELPVEVRPFVERGSTPIALEKADLNRDRRDDGLLVLKHAKPRIDLAWQLVEIEENRLGIHDSKQRDNRVVRKAPKDYGKIDFRAFKPIE